MLPSPSSAARPWLYAGIAALIGALMFYRMSAALSPLVFYILFLLLVSVWAGSREHLLLVTGATFALLIWMLEALGGLLAPFLLAFVIAYILDPAVDRLERRMSRRAAVAILLVPVLAALLLALGFGVPALLGQAENLIARAPAAIRSIAEWLDRLRDSAVNLRLPFGSGESVSRPFDMLTEERIATFLQERQDELIERGWGAVLGVGRGVTFLLSLLGFLVLTPVLIVYLLNDFNRITVRAGELVPVARRAYVLGLLAEYDALLSRFLRGQLLAAMIVGVLTWLGLLLLGFPYSGLVGAIAGVFNVVPYLGLIVSLVPAIIIALVSGSFLLSMAKVAAVFIIVQLIDSTVTGPRIVGSSVGLHPVWVILALAVGSFVFGFVGLLLAMPAAVLIKLLLRESLTRYRNSAFFTGDVPPPPDASRS